MGIGRGTSLDNPPIVLRGCKGEVNVIQIL